MAAEPTTKTERKAAAKKRPRMAVITKATVQSRVIRVSALMPGGEIG